MRDSTKKGDDPRVLPELRRTNKKRTPIFSDWGSVKKGDDPRVLPELRRTNKKRTPIFSDWGSIKKGDDILSHITAVPSAQSGLTSLFEMGRGEPRRNNHLKF